MSTMHTITHKTTLVVFDCANCGATMGVSDRFDDARREDKKSFYCPNGHRLSYHESESDKLRKKLKQEQDHREMLRSQLNSTVADLDHVKRQKTAYKGQLTRVKKGVCPYCNRSFENVRAHMATQHEGTDDDDA